MGEGLTQAIAAAKAFAAGHGGVTKETLKNMQNMDADELTKLVMAGNLDLRVKKPRAPQPVL
jgi:hypothetical protein